MRIELRLSKQAQSAELVSCALAALVKVNEYEYRMHGRSIPDLRTSSLYYRYIRRDPWFDVLSLFENGWGDCEDFASAFAVESRLRGTSPFVHVYATQVTPRLIHVYNGDGRGNWADLCIARGMRVPPGLDIQRAYERGFQCPV